MPAMSVNEILDACKREGREPPPWIAEAEALIRAHERPTVLPIGLSVDLAQDDAADRRAQIGAGS